MKTNYILRQKTKNYIGTVIGFGIIIYFGAHGVFGDRGINDWFEISGNLSSLEHEYILNDFEINSLKHRISLLRDEGLDLDFLDERARYVLGLAKASEILILDQ